MLPKTVALIAAVCLTAGWLLASLLMPPVATLQVLPERHAVSPAVRHESPPPYAEQLQLKVGQAPLSPSPRRNPFVFGTRERVAATRTNEHPTPLDQLTPDTPLFAPIVGPPYSLSGIGVTETPDGEVRTAVLSDGMTVHLVKAGDAVGGYRVTLVTDDAATLTDAAGAQYILRLRH